MAKFTEIVRERMARLFYGLFLWAAVKAPSVNSSQRVLPDYCDEHIGLACVLCSLQHQRARGGRILHTCMVKPCKFSRPLLSVTSLEWLSSSSASSWSLSTDGDLLGTESGVHMCSGEDAAPWEDAKPYVSRKQSIRTRRSLEKKRDIPPPLTILRGKGANEGRLVPWSLHREYRDGRLILREATVDDSASCCYETIEEETAGEQGLVEEEQELDANINPREEGEEEEIQQD